MTNAAKDDAPGLLPCPFCGGPAHIDGTSWTTRNGKDQAWVTCKNCQTYGPSSTDATAAWNSRSPEALAASPVVQAMLREARAEGMERAEAGCRLIADRLRSKMKGATLSAASYHLAEAQAVDKCAEAIRAEAAAVRKGETK